MKGCLADAKKPINGPEQLLIIISYYLVVNTGASALPRFSTEILLLSSTGFKGAAATIPTMLHEI